MLSAPPQNFVSCQHSVAALQSTCRQWKLHASAAANVVVIAKFWAFETIACSCLMCVCVVAIFYFYTFSAATIIPSLLLLAYCMHILAQSQTLFLARSLLLLLPTQTTQMKCGEANIVVVLLLLLHSKWNQKAKFTLECTNLLPEIFALFSLWRCSYLLSLLNVARIFCPLLRCVCITATSVSPHIRWSLTITASLALV